MNTKGIKDTAVTAFWILILSACISIPFFCFLASEKNQTVAEKNQTSTSEGCKIVDYFSTIDKEKEQITSDYLRFERKIVPSETIEGKNKAIDVWTYICPRCDKVVHKGKFLDEYIECSNCKLIFKNSGLISSILKSSPKWTASK